MKRRIQLCALWSVLVSSLLACQLFSRTIGERSLTGSGKVVTQERPVGSFTKLDLAAIGEMDIEQGDTPKLIVEADDNVIDKIKTDVEGDTLVIHMEGQIKVLPVSTIRYHLTVPSLELIRVSGLGVINAPAMNETNFEADVSGGGSINLAGLTADSLKVDISGLGNLKVGAGQLSDQTIVINGGGGYEAPDLASKQANVQIPGLGSATLRVSDLLQVKISGGGQVRYYGNPQVEKEISGLGSVEKIGE